MDPEIVLLIEAADGDGRTKTARLELREWELLQDAPNREANLVTLVYKLTRNLTE